MASKRSDALQRQSISLNFAIIEHRTFDRYEMILQMEIKIWTEVGGRIEAALNERINKEYEMRVHENRERIERDDQIGGVTGWWKRQWWDRLGGSTFGGRSWLHAGWGSSECGPEQLLLRHVHLVAQTQRHSLHTSSHPFPSRSEHFECFLRFQNVIIAGSLFWSSQQVIIDRKDYKVSRICLFQMGWRSILYIRKFSLDGK